MHSAIPFSAARTASVSLSRLPPHHLVDTDKEFHTVGPATANARSPKLVTVGDRAHELFHQPLPSLGASEFAQLQVRLCGTPYHLTFDTFLPTLLLLNVTLRRSF